jgi:hypothetical protein
VIPNHVLNGLTADDRVAILARGGEIHLLVHPAAADPAVIQANAERHGSEVLATHMSDPAAIQAFVASRERDIGGEG